MRKQNCCGAPQQTVVSNSQKKLNITKVGKHALRILVVLGVVAYTFISRIPVDAYWP